MTAMLEISELTDVPQRNEEESVRRVALVTGGTGSIGTEICKELAREGYVVATTYRNEEKARLWQEDMWREGYEIGLYRCDVSDFEDAARMVREVVNDIGTIGILVNNAGITRDVTLRRMTMEQWRDVIGTDLDGVFNITQPVIGGMLEQGFGRIINISSINGQKGQFGQSNYAAAKAGMHGFTKSLAQEVAGKGVTVNTISPGYIETEMVMSIPENIRKAIVAEIPVGRLGRPTEVARIVSFLADDDSSFITGANISMNGGHHME